MLETKTSRFGKLTRIIAIAFLIVGWQLQPVFSLPVQAGAAGSEQAARRDGAHDFDFDIGVWHTHIHRVLDPFSGSGESIDLDGTVTVRPVWGGRAQLEEIEADGPKGHWEGLSVFLYNPQSHQWSQSFLNSKTPVLWGLVGEFHDGRGELYAHDTFHDKSIFVRAVWSEITPNSHRYTEFVVRQLPLKLSLSVLEVPAGTGLLSQIVAPKVGHVVALDVTLEMIAEGHREVEQRGLRNIMFTMGAAEALPFPAQTFYLVMTGFSFHHIRTPEVVLKEMKRACRPGGSVVVVDLLASADDKLRKRYNLLERLRDSSHTEALSQRRMKSIATKLGMKAMGFACRRVGMDFEHWLNLLMQSQPPERKFELPSSSSRRIHECIGLAMSARLRLNFSS